jgi:lipopolysaccharide heptosyltransferase I
MKSRNGIPLADHAAERIALIKPSALGDIVHSLPVLSALRQRHPRAHITWIVNRAYAGLLEGHPDLDAVLRFERGALRSGWWRGLRVFAGFLRQVRSHRFDLVIDLQGLLRSALIVAASGAARKVGLSSAREGACWFYTDLLQVPGPEMHAVDRYWLVAEALGVGRATKRFHLPVTASDRHWAGVLLEPHPRPWLMVNPGTRWETKRWPVDHFRALSQRALARFGGTVVLVGGPDEVPLAREFAVALPRPVVDLTGRTTLPQLVAVLARADAVLSNDSGPLHLAAALGRPVLAPYTCTSPLRTGPYGSPLGAVATRVPCAASYRKHCGSLECMRELTPDRLWPTLEKLLERLDVELPSRTSSLRSA